MQEGKKTRILKLLRFPLTKQASLDVNYLSFRGKDKFIITSEKETIFPYLVSQQPTQQKRLLNRAKRKTKHTRKEKRGNAGSRNEKRKKKL